MGVAQTAGFNSFTIVGKGHASAACGGDNRYPGAACDVPSSLYSFSFEGNFDWSRSHGTHARSAATFEHLRASSD